MAVPIRWSGIDYPNDDLCTKRASGFWDVVSGVDGWVIYIGSKLPRYGGADDRARVITGASTREIARQQAEVLINNIEIDSP